MNATVAQLVEYDLAKVGVAGSSPVCRSLRKRGKPYKSKVSAIFVFGKSCIQLYTAYTVFNRVIKPVLSGHKFLFPSGD